MLATGNADDDTLGLWDTQTGTALLPPMDTSGDPSHITFSRDGELVACIVNTYSDQHLHTYETASGNNCIVSKFIRTQDLDQDYGVINLTLR